MIQKIEVNTDEKTIDLSVGLLGEVQPLALKITYELFQEGDHNSIKVISIQSPREWINMLFKELMNQGHIHPAPIPSGMTVALLKALGVLS